MLKARPMSSVLVAAFVAASTVVASSSALAVKVGPVEDPIGVVKVPKGSPITIGGMWVLSGPDVALGLDQRRGAEIALKDANNKVAGHSIKFVVEDDQCNAEGGQTAATKLAANEQLVVVLGPACSSVATPGAPILWKAGVTTICTSCTSPRLTASDRGPQYDGFMRTVYSDIWQAKYDAEWIYNVLGYRKIATIHDGSPPLSQLTTLVAKRFKELGGEVVAAEAISPTDVEMRPVLTKMAAAKPDAIYQGLFVAAAAHFVRQSKEIAGLEKVEVIGAGGTLFTKDFLVAAGKAAVGLRMPYPDVSTEALGKKYPDFVKKYKDMFGEAPIQGYHAHAYDAGVVALQAIEKVAVKDADGNTYIGRKALRDALFGTRGYDGISGPIACDPHGDCAKFKFAVYQFTDANPDSFSPGANPKKVYPTQ